MKELDFLPIRYRRDRGGHSRRIWRVGAVLAYAAFVALVCCWQVANHSRLKAEVAQASQQYDLMIAQANHCAALESQLRVVESEAELWTYLRHPWPHTQILAALAEPLPATISLEELQIARAKPAADAAFLRRDRQRVAQEGEPKQDNRPPAQRDLEVLKSECEAAPVVVTIEGATRDIAELHAYLGKLRQRRLFSQVELISAESREALGRPELQFTARLTLRPGYGQPNGPTSPVANAASKADHRT